MSRRLITVIAASIYIGGIVLANYLIVHGFPGATPTGFGTYTVPVGFGLVAPAGVYAIAATWPSRDLLQRSGGRLLGILAILVGAGVSWFVSSAAIAVASGGTLLISESCDFAVDTPVQRRWFTWAVIASGIVAAVVDSVIFLWWSGIGFGPDAVILKGQIVGKLWIVTLIAGPIAWALRKKVPTETLLPA